jgi:hypothetical protein
MVVGVLSMAEASLCVGIALLTLAAIWCFLFLYSKSPVKKYWWSIPDKLMVVTLQIPGYKAKVNDKNISVWIDLTSSSGIMVDRIDLKIERKRGIPSFEWNPQAIRKKYKFLDFQRPDWLRAGKYKAKLIAYTPEGYSKSGEFMLEVDVQNANIARRH